MHAQNFHEKNKFNEYLNLDNIIYYLFKHEYKC
jgi:hypothetical protein